MTTDIGRWESLTRNLQCYSPSNFQYLSKTGRQIVLLFCPLVFPFANFIVPPRNLSRYFDPPFGSGSQFLFEKKVSKIPLIYCRCRSHINYFIKKIWLYIVIHYFRLKHVRGHVQCKNRRRKKKKKEPVLTLTSNHSEVNDIRD